MKFVSAYCSVLKIATDKHGTQGVPDTDEETNICVHLCVSVAKISIAGALGAWCRGPLGRGMGPDVKIGRG